MSKSRPFDLMQILKSIWESHPINAGRKYAGGSRDLRAAKGWIELNGMPGEDVSDIVARFDRFAGNAYWLERGLPLYGFLDSYADFDAPRQKQDEPNAKVCGICGTRFTLTAKDFGRGCPRCYPGDWPLRIAQGG